MRATGGRRGAAGKRRARRPDDRRGGFPIAELLECRIRGIEVCDILEFFERESGRVEVELMQPSWLIFSDGFVGGQAQAAGVGPVHFPDLLRGAPDGAEALGPLAQVGLVEPSQVVEWRHHFLANAYPVYALDYVPLVRTTLEALSAIENLDTIGRGGRFFYTHLHDQMRFGKDYVASLANGRAHAAKA